MVRYCRIYTAVAYDIVLDGNSGREGFAAISLYTSKCLDLMLLNPLLPLLAVPRR